MSDLRQFVVAARPAMAAREFALMTTFPNKELVDESQTLQQANLLNAVIVQQLKWGQWLRRFPPGGVAERLLPNLLSLSEGGEHKDLKMDFWFVIFVFL